MLPLHLTEHLDRDAANVPQDFLDPSGRPDWQSVYRFLGLTDIDKLRDSLLAVFLLSPEVAVTTNRALLQVAFGLKNDPTHLSMLQSGPTEEAGWAQADAGCLDCPGSQLADTALPVPFGGRRLCGQTERIDCWANCLRYRENALKQIDEGETASSESRNAEIDLLLGRYRDLLERVVNEVSDQKDR